jgi:two-component system, cell cycle sensor histidine kinase and response regulator CckA
MKEKAMREHAVEDYPRYPWERAGRAGSWSWNASTRELMLWSREDDRARRDAGVPASGEAQRRIHPENEQAYLQRIAEAVRAQTDWDIEYRLMLPDGTTRDIQSIGHPVFDANAGLVEYVGMELDITERKRTEEALRESEARFRTFVDHAGDAFFLHDNEDQGRLLDVNRRACESLGYTREELIGTTAMVFDNWLTPAQLMRIAERVIAGEEFAFETRHTRKDGSDFPVEIHIRPFLHGGRALGLSLARDITERKQAERALNDSHDLLRAVIEGTPDAIYAKDLQHRYRMINSAGARFMGKAVDEVLGKDDSELLAPDAARAIRERDLRILVSGQQETFEETVSAGGTSRVYLSTKAPYRDRQGNVIGLVGISRDVTDMKRLETDFRQAQKMDAVGRLAGGIAHDFNNLLSVIIGYSELLFNQLSPEDDNRNLIYEVQKAGERAAGLTRQLLAFSRKQVLKPQVISLNPLLADMNRMLRRLIGKDIALIEALDPQLGMTKVDPGQFEQAVINLAVNARDAMKEAGRLTIETRNARVDQKYAEAHPGVRPGDYVVVAVSDTGHGMDEATQARIFEPFFTTKEAGKGTGLGLAMVYGFAKQSDGHIEVQSQPDSGTSFRLFLPRVADAETALVPAVKDFRVTGGQETIMLVEDEEALRTLIREVLQSYGYTVLEARDGEDGLWMARQYAGPIHALLTDLVMPRMGGRELAEQLSRQRPNLRVMFMSGHAKDAFHHRGDFRAGAAFVHKPFSPLALAREVRHLLDADASA